MPAVFFANVGSTPIEVSGVGCHIVCIELTNPGASLAYLQVFNRRASGVTLGTTAPDFVASAVAGGNKTVTFPVPARFKNGVTIACTTTPTGSTAAPMHVSLLIT
ncbi:MAG: hypothetical protein QXD59_02080 [Candidatus Caldarchaeum sp.]